VLLLTCDQPRIPLAALEALVARWRSCPERVVASAYAGIVGVPAILPARTFPALMRLNGDRGARDVLRAEQERIETVPIPEAACDVDDEQALQALEADGQPEPGGGTEA
jgi:CTP:molybdopterin cytidylyltransferase MocA